MSFNLWCQKFDQTILAPGITDIAVGTLSDNTNCEQWFSTQAHTLLYLKPVAAKRFGWSHVALPLPYSVSVSVLDCVV